MKQPSNGSRKPTRNHDQGPSSSAGGTRSAHARDSLLEADDPVAVSRFFFAGADLVDQKVVPVVDDEEIGKALSE